MVSTQQEVHLVHNHPVWTNRASCWLNSCYHGDLIEAEQSVSSTATPARPNIITSSYKEPTGDSTLVKSSSLLQSVVPPAGESRFCEAGV